ncbi:MAG: hypothetical protein ACT4P7_03080 [Gemmatimonadaceae bacterium]
MARKPNYDFEKRRKELERKARKDAKLAEKQRRNVEGQPSGDGEPLTGSEPAPAAEG